MDSRSPDRVAIMPASKIDGDVTMPGDKSISHRLAMIGSIAEGTTTIHNFAASADSHSTLSCLERLGVSFAERDSTVMIEGRGLSGLSRPSSALNAENSGTTVRMLSGILAACPFTSTFVGDESLSRRPMRRILEPLRMFGARLEARDDNFLPIHIHGTQLQAIEYQLPVASAQVKSAILLAGLQASGTTRVTEPSQTRNHTEIALKEFGAALQVTERQIEIQGGQRLIGHAVTVPGDVSSAAFFVAAALTAKKGALQIRHVGLNPTRTGFLTVLQQMGAQISIEGLTLDGGEPVGDLIVQPSNLTGMEIRGHWIPNVIDEIPVLAVLGTRTRDGLRIRDAAELRVKESDRISVVVQNLRALGVHVDEYEDGLFVPGNQKMHGGTVHSRGDHRIAMAFAIAGLLATETVTIESPACVAVSFPEFFDLLADVTDQP